MLNQKQADILERKVLRNGVVLYTILGSKGYTYFITVTNGKVDEATHQDCPGFCQFHKCYHVRDVLAMEGEIAAEAKMNAYRTCYDDMAAEKTASIEAVRQAAYAEAQNSGLAGSYRAEWYR